MQDNNKSPDSNTEVGVITNNLKVIENNIGALVIKNRELLKAAEIDPNKNIITPPSIFSIDDISYGSLGNFSCLTGKSKSRKTFFLTILIAAAIDEKGNFQRIKTEISQSTVLHFDTEQSQYHTQIVARRVVSLLDSDTNIDNYKCYCLRPFDPKKRIELIEEAINSTEDVKLVIIDGIADLIIGYNNEEEAIKVISKFMKWTAEKNIHIITVVHQNKADNNAKGHLGSLIYQKAETVLSIEKDGNISKVNPTHSRGIDIQPISFSIDDNGIPFFVDHAPNITSNSKRKPFDFEFEVHKTILKEVFEGLKEMKSTDFADNLKFVLGKHDINIGNGAIRDWRIYYDKLKMIIKDNQQAPYRLGELVS